MSSKDASDTDHSVLLSDATLSALQIDHQPFGPLASDSVLYLDETTSEQLADVKQALITGDDLLLILGASGAGKSVLLKQLGENSGLRIQCFAVKGSSRFSTLNLFAGMLEAFKRPPPDKLKDILDELIPCLQTMVTRNTLSAIVLDDAHRVTETELTQLLSSMLYLNSQDETLLRVALAAPADFEDHIPDLLPEGADLPYSSLTIEGMDEPRAADYLAYRMAQAGFAGEWPFTERDIKNLVAQTGGLPAELHAATAVSLNQRYGPVEDIIPEELISESNASLMDSRFGKLALGVLAAVLIVGGLSMFIPEKSDDNADRYATDETIPEVIDESDQTLRLVETEPLVQTETFTVTEVLTTENAEEIAAQADSSASTSDTELVDTPDESPATTALNETIATENAELASPSTGDIAQTPTEEPSQVVIVADSATPDAPRAVETANSAASDAVNLGGEQALDLLSDSTAAVDEAAEAIDTGALPADSTPQQRSAVDETTTDVDPELVGILESPTWILVQDSNLFTVQMSASRDRASVENFLKRNASALPTPNSIYTFTRDEETWFALLNGVYPSIDDARTAVESMPASALTNQPWIRSVGRVQDVLKAQ